jgi:hypothetical protein
MPSLSMDTSSSLAVALQVFFLRNVLMIMHVNSRVADSISEISFVACINVVLESCTAVEAQTLDQMPRCVFCGAWRRLSCFVHHSYSTVSENP